MLPGIGRYQARILTQLAVALLLLTDGFTSPSAAESSAVPPITVLSIQEIIPKDSLKLATAATAIPGGFLIAGGHRIDQYNRHVLQQFYLRLSSAGDVIWEQTSDLKWPSPAPTAALLLTEGGYGILSNRFEKDVDQEIKNARLAGKGTEGSHIMSANQYDSLDPLAATGSLRPEIRLSEPGESRYIDCGVATRSGFLFAGQAFSSQGGIALIEMRDRDGKLLWERQYPGEQERALDISPQLGQTECGSIVVAFDDSATIALNIRILPVTHSADEWVKVVSSPATNHQGVLVIRLDSKGQELSRAVDENVTGGLLLPAAKQTLLVESTVPQFPAPGSMPLLEQLAEIKKLSATGYRIRLKYLDGAGNRAVSPQDISGGALETVRALYRTPEGDLLLAGCPQLGGNNYLLHVNASGAASPVVELTPGHVQQCAKVVFGAGVHPHEAAVFMLSDLIGAQLVTVKY